MNQKSLSRRIKLIIIGVGVCGLFFYSLILPYIASALSPTDDSLILLVFLLVSAVPCYAALVFAYKIAYNIGCDRSFSEENARYLMHISTLAAIDSAYIFVGSAVLLLLRQIGALLISLSLVIVFAGVAISVAAAALSHLVLKAAELQADSDLTI